MKHSHLYYEALRDPDWIEGTIPPEAKGYKYSKGTQLLKKNGFKVALYQALKCMWNAKDRDGVPKKLGQSYHPGIEFKPFKPEDMSIVGYRGRMKPKHLSKGKQWKSGASHSELYRSKWIDQDTRIHKWELLLP